MTGPAAPRVRVVLGRVVATPGLLEVVDNGTLARALARHASGDWGLVGVEDAAANDDAVRHGDRILSVYESAAGFRFWLITEADRSATTALLPAEY